MSDILVDLASEIRSHLDPADQNDPQQLGMAVNYWIWRHILPESLDANFSPYYTVEAGVGECTARSILACTLLDLLGIQNRMITLYNYLGHGIGHTVFEAGLGNDQWALFDPLVGAYFTDDGTPGGRVVSMEEVTDTADGFYQNRMIPYLNGAPDYHPYTLVSSDDPNWNQPAFYSRDVVGSVYATDDGTDTIGFYRDFSFKNDSPETRLVYQATVENGVWHVLQWNEEHVAVPAEGLHLGKVDADWYSPTNSADLDINIANLENTTQIADGVALDFTTPGSYQVIMWPGAHTHLFHPLDIVDLAPADQTYPIGPDSTLIQSLTLPIGDALEFTVDVGPDGREIAIRPGADVLPTVMNLDALWVLPADEALPYDQFLYTDFNHRVVGTNKSDFIASGHGNDVLIGDEQWSSLQSAGSWTGAGYIVANQPWYIGDFNGDGRDDIFRYGPTYGIEVRTSSGTSFVNTGRWTSEALLPNQGNWYIGDFNGDGKDDILRYHLGVSGAEVLLSDGHEFGAPSNWTTAGLAIAYGQMNGGWYVGDFNGDGRDDIFRYVPGTSGADMFLSSGSNFLRVGSWTSAGDTGKWYIGDFDGDGKDDLLTEGVGGTGAYVLLSHGSYFSAPTLWTSAQRGQGTWQVADVDGDGRSDLVLTTPGSGSEVFLSNGASFVDSGRLTNTNPNGNWFVGDFNGDHQVDLFQYSPGYSGADMFLSDGSTHQSNLFSFVNNFGTDTITDFDVFGSNHDVIQIDSSVSTSFSDVIAHAQQVGHDTILSFDASDVLTLKDVAMNTLTSDHFLFA